jgi:hypothetical protein
MANAARPPVEVAPAAASIAFAIHTGHIGLFAIYFGRVIEFTLII